jgi:hypothetical protein
MTRLESRRLLAAVSWTGLGDGVNWDSANNWSTHAVPTINDDVTINLAASDPTVTIRTNANCRSLVSFERMYLSYPGNFVNFKVATTATINHDFRVENVMDGGTWSGTGRIRIMNNAALHINPQTINCDVVFDSNSVWNIEGSLVFNGTMYLGQPGTPSSNEVFISGSESRTLTGSGTFVFDSTEATFSSAICNNITGFGNTLTIGPNLKFDVRTFGRIHNNYVGDKVFFQATVDVNGSGKTFIVNNTFMNQGTLRARNGGFIGMAIDRFSNIGNLDLQSGGLATIQSAHTLPPEDGEFSVDAPLTVPADTTLALSGDFNLNAPIDVSGNFIWEYSGASPIDTLRQLIRSGYNQGNWDGPGIRSSRAAASKSGTLGLGYMESSELLGASGGAFAGMQVDGTALLVTCTKTGDANLDGRVNFDDYVRTDNGFNNHRTGWSNGDFNYDGKIDFDDYVLIDLSFNSQ